MKNINKKGISLIVLIITIIVIIILAAAVILTLSKNNPIESAKEAAFKEDIRAYQDELNMYITKEYQQLAGQRDSKITATGYEKDSTSEEYNNSVYKYLSSFKKKYENKIAIENDEIVYIGRDKKEREWTNNIVKMNPILTVKYVYENGEEAAPTYEETVTDGAYEVDSPIIDGYEPDHYTVSDKMDKDTEITVTYYPWSEGLAYEELTDGTYTVAGIGTFTGENLVIPRKYNGKDVTEIKANAFFRNNDIKKLIISKSMKVVNAASFNDCHNLIYINLDTEKVKSMYAFRSNNLKSVDIGKNVKDIGNRSFISCISLVNVNIFTEKANINCWQFEGCNMLENIKVNKNNNKYKEIDGVLFSIDEKIIYMHSPGRKGEYIIFSNTEIIGEMAFHYNKYLGPNLYIPNNVKEVKSSAFNGSSIIYANINSEKMYYGSFGNCLLEKIEIGENVKYIENRSFINCINLSEIKICSEIVEIDGWQFEGCTSLSNIVVNSNNKKYKSIEGSLYSVDGKKLYLYAIGKGSKCVIPDGVEELGNYSIRWDKKTTEVQLPKSVKKIGNQSFGYSTSINKFIYLGTKEEWNNINKASSWKDNSSITKVICTDGEIEL